MITPHALKLEELNLKINKANKIVAVLNEFLTDLEFDQERIEPIECRRRDGFIPYSHNKGGLQAISYIDQVHAEVEKTGFINTDKTLDKYYENDLKSFLEDNKLNELTEEDYESFDDYRSSGNDTVMFSAQLVLNDDNNLTIFLDVSAKDSPYHRQYDDRLEFKVNFKTVKSLQKQLADILLDENVLTFKANISEAW